MRRLLLTVLLLSLSQTLPAQDPGPRLGDATAELEAIISDLEETHRKTAELRERLASLEALSAEHQAALAEQQLRLAQYQEAVAALEAHDRASLALADELRGQLAAERALGGWLWPALGVAVGVAVLEGLLLGWSR